MFNVQLQVFFGYLENLLYQISMIFKYSCQECNIYMVKNQVHNEKFIFFCLHHLTFQGPILRNSQFSPGPAALWPHKFPWWQKTKKNMIVLISSKTNYNILSMNYLNWCVYVHVRSACLHFFFQKGIVPT